MDFGYALKALKEGLRVFRYGWNGKGMWISIKKALPAEVVQIYPAMTVDYIFMKTADNQFVPWLASQTDLLAEDWMIVAEKEEVR